MTIRPGGLSYEALLTVHRLRDNAYGVTIRDDIAQRTGRNYAFGPIYTTLARLQADGLLTSKEGAPTPERGGRAKRLYQLTGHGVAVLTEGHRQLEATRAAFEPVFPGVKA
ncbi:MAG: PadR family transcriptional regulator [Geminicoccaceae bacterium]